MPTDQGSSHPSSGEVPFATEGYHDGKPQLIKMQVQLIDTSTTRLSYLRLGDYYRSEGDVSLRARATEFDVRLCCLELPKKLHP